MGILMIALFFASTVVGAVWVYSLVTTVFDDPDQCSLKLYVLSFGIVTTSLIVIVYIFISIANHFVKKRTQV